MPTQKNVSILITVPGVPTNVYYTTMNESVDIHWEDPVERNGVITNYIIWLTYQEQICRGKGDVVHETYVIQPFNNYTLNNLSSYWDYNFNITATNKIGSGIPTETYAFRTNASCAYSSFFTTEQKQQLHK